MKSNCENLYCEKRYINIFDLSHLQTKLAKQLQTSIPGGDQ